MTSNQLAYGIVKAVGILSLIAAFLWLIIEVQTILIYIAVSLILALIANPIVEFLRRKLKFKNTMAVVTTLLFFVFILLGLLSLFVPLLIDQTNNLSLLNTKQIENQSVELYVKLNEYLNSHNISLSKIIKESELTSKLNFSVFTDFFNSIISGVSSFGIGLATCFFITFFLLKDKVMFIVGFKRIIPESQEDKILSSLEKINEMLSRYFIGLIIQLTIIFILYLIVLLIFGVDNAFVIAFLCAVLNIIPYVGPLIGSVLAGILTMLSNLNNDFQSVTLPTTLYVMIGFFIVQLIDNNVSSPIIFSKSVNSHPLEIFLVVLVAGTLFGITGMIIAVPLFTALKVTAKEFFPDNRVVKTMTRNL